MEDIVKIVEREIVAKMDNSLELLNVAGIFITVCNVKWARKGKDLKDENDVIYKILAVDYETNLITLNAPFVGLEVYLDLPFFVHGTPKETNEEWTKNPIFELDKLPVIWLVEPLDERPFGRESSIERESDLRLVLFDSRDGTNWITKTIHSERTQSLLNMVAEIEKVLKKNQMFKTLENSRVRNLNKLGTENLGSFEKNIINADLTAIDYRITVSMFRDLKCKC